MSNSLEKAVLSFSIGYVDSAVSTLGIIVNERVKSKKKLESEEKEMLQKSYKELIEIKRSMRFQLEEIINDKNEKSERKNVAEVLKKEINAEINKISQELLGNIKKFTEGTFSPKLDNSDIVFYKKLEADVNRFVIETISEEKLRKEKIDACKKLYETAVDDAKELKVYDSLRLGLLLSYGRFSEILTDEEDKRKILQKVSMDFNECLNQLDKLSEDDFVKAVKYMTKMKEITTEVKNN